MKTSQLKTNNKKKVLSMLLALTMIFQISIPAVFAEGEENQKKIIAFEELADDVKNITVEGDSTEVELVAKMPSSLNASYQETTTGSAIEITIENVTWELDEANIDSATFDSSQNGASYTYKAKLPATDSTGDELVLESGVSLPTITVLVGAVPMLMSSRGTNPVTELWIGPTKVVSEGAVYTTSGIDWSYDNSTCTLTLNGANISELAPNDLIKFKNFDDVGNIYGIYCIGDLNIINTGTNTIDIRDASLDKSKGLKIYGNLTVTGSGKLTLAGLVRGIEGNDLTVKENVELECISSKETEYTNYSGRGISIYGAVIVSDKAHLIGRANRGNENTGIFLLGSMSIESDAMVSAFAMYGSAGGNIKGFDALNANIEVNGKLIVESGNAGDKRYGSGIFLMNSNLKVLGTGSVEVRAGNPGPTSGFGVYGVNAIDGGSITIDGGGFLASGGSGAIYPSSTPVTITEPPVYYEISENKDGSNPTIYTSAEDWATVNGKFENIKYIKATTIYDVYVNDVQVTRLNSHDVLGDGTVSYEVANGANPATLRLNNASFAGDLNLSEPTSIILTGENAVGDIHTKGELKLGGSGELTLNGSLEGTDTKVIVEGQAKLITSRDITIKELINNPSIENNAKLTITDSISGSGDIINEERIVFPSSTDENFVKNVTGDGLCEIVTGAGAPSAFYSQGRRLFLVTDSLDFTTDPSHGSYKAGATLETDGYSFDSINKVLTLGNILIGSVYDYAIKLPKEATVTLEGISHISAGKLGILADDNLIVDGAGFLKIETENLPCILANKTLSINDGKIIAKSSRIALLVLDVEPNSNGIILGKTRRILTPENANIISSQTQAFGVQNVSSVLSPSENILRIDESNPASISGTNAAEKVVINKKLEQDELSVNETGLKTYGDEAFTLATTGGSGEGDISFESSDAEVLSINGDIATIKKAGNVTITAKKHTDRNYLETFATKSINISKKALNIKADDKLNIVKGSPMPTLTYKVNGLLKADSLTKEPVITTSATDTNAVGEYVISISEAEVSNSDSYEISYTNGKMTVINSGSGNNGNNGDSGNNSGNGSSSGSSSNKDDKDDKEPTKAPVNQTPPAQAELPLQTSEQNSTNAPVFTDTENHWAKSDIEFVTKRGLFGGTGDGKFSPNMPMTRGMFVTVLGKLAKADLTGFTSSSFKDVKSDAYYLPYIQWANTSGIVNGISSEEFAPDMEISREQMAVMLLNYIKAMNIDIVKLNEENQFADTDEMSTWAKEAVKAIQMSGILSGKPDNKFDPKGIATRAEVSSMLRKLIELTEQG